MWSQFVDSLRYAAAVTLPSLLLLMFGVLLRKGGQIGDAFVAQASRLMFNWALPCLLFFSVYQADTPFSEHKSLLTAGAVTALILFFGAWAVSARLVPNPALKGVFIQSIYRGNTAIMGIAYCANAYGEAGMVKGSLYAGSMTLLFNILAVIAMTMSVPAGKEEAPDAKGVEGTQGAKQAQGDQGAQEAKGTQGAKEAGGAAGRKADWRRSARQIVTNPLIIAILLAMLCRAFELKLPGAILKTGLSVAQCALPISLICVGASFQLKTVLQPHSFAMRASEARLVASPVVAGAVGLAFALPAQEFGVLLLMGLTPVATASYVMVKAMGGDDIAMANVIGITNFLSIFAAAVYITLAHALGWM